MQLTGSFYKSLIEILQASQQCPSPHTWHRQRKWIRVQGGELCDALSPEDRAALRLTLEWYTDMEIDLLKECPRNVKRQLILGAKRILKETQEQWLLV